MLLNKITRTSLTQNNLIRSASILLGLTGISIATLLSSAQPAWSQNNQQQSAMQFRLPDLPYDRGAPGKRGEGASRGDLCGLPVGPIALTPHYSETVNLPYGETKQNHYVLSKTSKARPSFAVYMPLAAQDVVDMQLTLLAMDEAGEMIYDLPIPAPSQAGVLTIQPAESEPALVAGQRYSWAIEVDVICSDEQPEPEYHVLEGQIEHLAMETGEDWAELSAEEQAIAYAEQGFWHEAMELVTTLHRQAPDNVQYQNNWETLLEGIGLERLADMPLLDCLEQLKAEA